METKIVVKDHPNGRKNLAEGRSNQMGFAFLKKNSEQEYEAIYPLSCCKDYLNDIIFTLHTGIPIAAYGLTSKKEDSKYLQEGYVYLGFKILPYKSNEGSHAKKYNEEIMPEDRKRLKANRKYVEQFMHFFEEKLNVRERTIIKEAEDDFYVAIVPPYWAKYQYLTSLYALMLRVAQYYDGSVSPKQFSDTLAQGQDLGLWKSAQPKLDSLIQNGVWEMNYEKLGEAMKKGAASATYIHSAGINMIHSYLKDYITPFVPTPGTAPQPVTPQF